MKQVLHRHTYEQDLSKGQYVSWRGVRVEVCRKWDVHRSQRYFMAINYTFEVQNARREDNGSLVAEVLGHINLHRIWPSLVEIICSQDADTETTGYCSCYVESGRTEQYQDSWTEAVQARPLAELVLIPQIPKACPPANRLSLRVQKLISWTFTSVIKLDYCHGRLLHSINTSKLVRRLQRRTSCLGAYGLHIAFRT